jgi:hypothetical protein
VILFLAMAFVACKKVDVKPAEPQRVKPQLYRWHIAGFVADSLKAVKYPTPYTNDSTEIVYPAIDSSSIFVNGVLHYRATIGYHVEFKKGDKITFYFRGKVDPKSPYERGFYFWQDKNEVPQVKFFKAEEDFVSGEFIIE